MPVATKLFATTIDCPDPRALAAFYRGLTGWGVIYEDDECVALVPEGKQDGGLNFQRVADYTAPKWPSQAAPQQFHLDFFAGPDLDAAQAEAVALGAVAPDEQPQADRWRVLLDPAGHPFCLCRSEAE